MKSKMMNFVPPSLKNTVTEEYPGNSEQDNPSTLNKHREEPAQYPARITFASPSELAILSCPPSPRSRSRPKKKEWPNLIQFLDIFPTPPSAKIRQKTRKGNWSPKVMLGQNQNKNHTQKEQIRQPHPRQRYTATFSSKCCHNRNNIIRKSYDVNESPLKNTDNASADADYSSRKSMDVRTDRQFKCELSQVKDVKTDNFPTAANENKGSGNTNEDVSDFLRMELLANVLTRISQPNQNESNSNLGEVQQANSTSLPTEPVVENKKRTRDRFNQCRKCLKYEKLLKKSESRIKHFENLKIFCNKEMEILREDLSKAKAKIAEQSVTLERLQLIEGPPSWIPLVQENVENTSITQFSSAGKRNPNVDYFACRTFDTELNARLQLGFPHKIYSAEVHTSKRRQRHRQKIEEIRKKFKLQQINGDNTPVKVHEQEKILGLIGSDEFISNNKPVRKFRICSGTVGIRSRSTPSDPSKRYNLKKKTYVEIHQRRMSRSKQHDAQNQLTVQQNNANTASENMRKRTQSLPRNSKVSISSTTRSSNSSNNVEILAVAVASREGLIREIAHSIAKAKKILHFRFDMLIASDFQMEDFHFLLTSHRRFIRWLHNYVNYSRSLMRQFDEKHLKPGATKLFVPAVIRLNQNETYKGIFIPIPQTSQKSKNNKETELNNDENKMMYLEKPLKDASTQETQTIQSMKTTMSLAIQSCPKKVDFQQNFNSDSTMKTLDETLPIYQSEVNVMDEQPNEEFYKHELSFLTKQNLMDKTQTQDSECGDENYQANLIEKSQNDSNNNNTICALANLTVDSLRCAINDMDSSETFRNALLTLPKHRNVALQSIENSTAATVNFNPVQSFPCVKQIPVSFSSNTNNNEVFTSDLNVNLGKFQTESEIDSQKLQNDTKSHFLSTDIKQDNLEETPMPRSNCPMSENFTNLSDHKSSIEITSQNEMSFQPFKGKFVNEKSSHGDQFNKLDDKDDDDYESYYYDPIITECNNPGRRKSIRDIIAAENEKMSLNKSAQEKEFSLRLKETDRINQVEIFYEDEEDPEDKIYLEESEKVGKIEHATYNDDDNYISDEVSPPHTPCYQSISMSDSNPAQNFITRNNDFLPLTHSNIHKDKDIEKNSTSPSHESFSPLDLIHQHHLDTAQKFYCHQGNFDMRALDPNNFIPNNNNHTDDDDDDEEEDKSLTNQQQQLQQQKQHLIQNFILKATSLDEPKISSSPVLLQLSKSGERKSVLDFSQMEKYFEDNVKKYKETLITEKIQNKSHVPRFPSAVQFVQDILQESKEKTKGKEEKKNEHAREHEEKLKNLEGDQQPSESLSLIDYKAGSVYTPEIEKVEQDKKQEEPEELVVPPEEEISKTVKCGKSKLNFMRPSLFSSSSSLSINSKKKERDKNLKKNVPTPPQPNIKNKQIIPQTPKSKPSFIFQNWKTRKTTQEQVESKIITVKDKGKISTDDPNYLKKDTTQKQSGREKAKSFIQNDDSNESQVIIQKIIPSRLPVPISPIIIQVKPSTTPGISEIQLPKALKCNSIASNVLADKENVQRKEKEKNDDKKEKPKRPSYIPVKTKTNSNTINYTNPTNVSRSKILPQTSITRREKSFIPVTTSFTSRAKTIEGITNNGRDKMGKSLSFSNTFVDTLSKNKRETSPKKMWSKAMERLKSKKPKYE